MLSRALPAAVLAAACALPASASVVCSTFGQSHYMLPQLCDELNKDVDAIRNAASPERRAEAERRFRDNLEKFKELSGLEIGSGATVHQKTVEFEREAKAARDYPLRAPGPGKPEQRQEPDRSTREQRAAAEAQLNAGNPAGAVAALDRLIASGQADAETLSLRARAKAAQGDGQGALADARAALARNPEDPQLKALVSGLEGSAAAAEKLKRTNFDLGAQRAPEQAPGAGTVRPAGPAAPAAPRPGAPGVADAPAADVAAPQVRVLLQRAQKLIDIGDLTGGLLHLREAIDLEPGRGELWDLLAELSNKLGNHEGAVAAAERALALDPQDARALRARSYAYYQLGRYREALADADRAIALEPGNGLGHLYRAMALEKLGDAAGALQSYRNAVRLDPTLAPLADAAIKRLSGGGAPAGLSRRGKLFRVGAVALSTLLIMAGLMGTAAGRRLTQGARRLITPLPPPRDDAAPPSIAVGSVVGGHYRVTRELGRGGMGVVYQAHDETLQRPVAIKQLQSAIRSDPLELERFLREARLVAQLKHPNLAQIYSVVEGGDLLLVFEYVEGQPLDRLLRDASPLSPSRALTIIGQISAALQYAHERRIVHRDLKPANVMLDPSGLAKVMDFGIAHQSRGLATLTMTAVSGTPPYMSPEQSLGSVSPSSDLYSLAVMSYEMLSGRRPFDGPDLHGSKLRKDFLPPSTLNPALPRALDAFFSRALDPDPAKRPADASSFAFELGRALDATPSRA